MYGQMTAGSWIYIGTQGILQGTYETFAAVAEQRFGGTLRGRVCLTAGLGGMGGAQPLAITMNEGVALCVEVDTDRIERRISHRYLDERIDDLDGAIERAEEAKRAGEPLSIGVLGNAAEVFPSWSAATSPTSLRIRPPPTTRSRATSPQATISKPHPNCARSTRSATSRKPAPRWPATARPW